MGACAVDGKMVRGLGDTARGLRHTHIVSTLLDDGRVVGQVQVVVLTATVLQVKLLA